MEHEEAIDLECLHAGTRRKSDPENHHPGNDKNTVARHKYIKSKNASASPQPPMPEEPNLGKGRMDDWGEFRNVLMEIRDDASILPGIDKLKSTCYR